MYAYEILSYIYAGLIMTTIDGKLDWQGERKQFEEAKELITNFETFV